MVCLFDYRFKAKHAGTTVGGQIHNVGQTPKNKNSKWLLVALIVHQ